MLRHPLFRVEEDVVDDAFAPAIPDEVNDMIGPAGKLLPNRLLRGLARKKMELKGQVFAQPLKGLADVASRAKPQARGLWRDNQHIDRQLDFELPDRLPFGVPHQRGRCRGR